MTCNQACCALLVDSNKADFLFLYFQLLHIRSELKSLATGAAQQNLSGAVIKSLHLPFPPLPEQRAIAHILGTLDDKIELNRRQSETLQEIARALFKAWFVDFEPVRAKMSGRWQRGQTLPGLPAHLYDLFPDRLVETEHGEVPQGWEMRPLDSVAHYLNGLALQKFPAESDDEFLPVIKIAQLRAGNTNGADRASARIAPEYIVNDGDVLFSWSGSLEVEVWNGGQGALNQHLFKVTSSEVPKWFYFFATRHHLTDFRAIAAGKATTMGHIQRKHLTQAHIAVAPEMVMKRLDAAIAPFFEQMIGVAQQSHTLAALRDTLLPQLLSGALRVPDAEKFLQARGL
ncbi:MAG: restriction endonuclease subunit S [Ottowia sp.]|nr:restriction endonuclease subunit S [Ottowia sp.]